MERAPPTNISQRMTTNVHLSWWSWSNLVDMEVDGLVSPIVIDCKLNEVSQISLYTTYMHEIVKDIVFDLSWAQADFRISASLQTLQIF